MLSRIQIGFWALLLTAMSAPTLTFAQVQPALLPPLDSLNFAAMQQFSAQLYTTALGLQQQAKQAEVLADSAQSIAVQGLNLAKQDSTSAKSLLDSLTKETKRVTDARKKASNLSSKTDKTCRFLESFPGMDSLMLRKNLPKGWKQVNQLHQEIYPAAPVEKAENEGIASEPAKPKKEKKKKEEAPAETPEAPVPSPPAPGPVAAPSKRFVAYNPANDVMLRPPTPPCSIASSSRDEFSGELSREMSRAELFRYTNPALKNYLQGKTHVICEAALSSAGPNNALQLTFTINDPNARKAFGRLDKNSLATLKFIDGTTFMLQNAVPDDGVFDPETGATLFRAQYPVTIEILKKMRKTELDKLRIAWSNGYDDYEVQQVDLLMRQADCLLR